MVQFLATLLANPLAVIGAASPFIIKSIDANRARIEAAARLHDAEIKAATDLALELISAADRMIYTNRQAMFGVVLRGLSESTITKKDASDPERKHWDAFQAELLVWNSNRNSRLARVFATYDEDTVDLFSGLSKQIEMLENMVEAGFFERPHSRFFIEDTYRPPTPPTDKPPPIPPDRCPGNVKFLIEKLEIRQKELPGLVAHIGEFCISCEPVPEKKQTDFRCKYFPVYESCEKELFKAGGKMLIQIQAQQVGALRHR